MRAEFYGEPWRTVGDVAGELGVPTEAVHHLVNAGIIEYSTDREFRTCVKLGEVTEALESNARLRLGGLTPLEPTKLELQVGGRRVKLY